jgi:hypothetical protein
MTGGVRFGHLEGVVFEVEGGAWHEVIIPDAVMPVRVRAHHNGPRDASG